MEYELRRNETQKWLDWIDDGISSWYATWAHQAETMMISKISQEKNGKLNLFYRVMIC